MITGELQYLLPYSDTTNFCSQRFALARFTGPLFLFPSLPPSPTTATSASVGDLRRLCQQHVSCLGLEIQRTAPPRNSTCE